MENAEEGENGSMKAAERKPRSSICGLISYANASPVWRLLQWPSKKRRETRPQLGGPATL